MNSNISIPLSVIELFLPKNTLTWFDIVDGQKKDNTIIVTLEEKNEPPLPPWYKNEQVISKGFREITVKDFPIRGNKVLLVFRRRTWEIKEHHIRLKREIKLVAEGTTLEQEFADFLKE